MTTTRKNGDLLRPRRVKRICVPHAVQQSARRSACRSRLRLPARRPGRASGPAAGCARTRTSHVVTHCCLQATGAACACEGGRSTARQLSGTASWVHTPASNAPAGRPRSPHWRRSPAWGERPAETPFWGGLGLVVGCATVSSDAAPAETLTAHLQGSVALRVKALCHRGGLEPNSACGSANSRVQPS
jgi:hypothetical protein